MNKLMTKVLEQINLEPGTWNQGSWIAAKDDTDPMCGTTCCVAGWAMLLSGQAEQKLWVHENEDGTKYVHDAQLIWPGTTYGCDPEILSESDYMYYAGKALDLDEEQARSIFMFTNTHDPQVMTNHIKGVIAGTMTHDVDEPCTC